MMRPWSLLLLLPLASAGGCAKLGKPTPAPATAPHLASPAPASEPVTYSWQMPQARVLPEGNLEWKPQTYLFRPGIAVRYIDFENGSDSNPGTTPAKPWKHHPWDTQASEEATKPGDADTFIFKGGVAYHGQLRVASSGTAEHPIQLVGSPSWGAGPAVFIPLDHPSADSPRVVQIADQSHIRLAGLAFRPPTRATKSPAPAIDDQAVIQVSGASSHIVIAGCTFEDVPLALYVSPLLPANAIDELEFTDNRIDRAAIGAVHVTGPGTIDHIRVLRNLARDSGQSVITLQGARLSEVAGNIIERAGRAGILIDGGNLAEMMVGRTLVHQNKVTDASLSSTDSAAIACRQGGMVGVFDNLCGSSRPGDAFALEGPSSAYLFNNIAYGWTASAGTPAIPSVGLNQTTGARGVVANNTFFRLGEGMQWQGTQGSLNLCLGNIWSDMSYGLFMPRGLWRKNPNATVIGYAGNVFYGHPSVFGAPRPDEPPSRTFVEFKHALDQLNAYSSDLGALTQAPPLASAAGGDYRPTSAAAQGRAARFFVPFGLYATVGEWIFRLNPANPNSILDDSPFALRYALEGNAFTSDSYKVGRLEDWTRASLSFNGVDQYLRLDDSILKADLPARGGEAPLPAWRQASVDMSTNSFLIEASIRIDPNRPGGAIVSKMGESGYELRVTDDAGIAMILRSPRHLSSVAQSARLKDGRWHHLLVEVDRPQSMITLYIDGQFTSGGGPIGPESLANNADFVVGRDTDGRCFAGEIEFLRVSRGTLADAKTTIQELYAWEFDGPQHRDFTGLTPPAKRPAGAIAK